MKNVFNKEVEVFFYSRLAGMMTDLLKRVKAFQSEAFEFCFYSKNRCCDLAEKQQNPQVAFLTE